MFTQPYNSCDPGAVLQRTVGVPGGWVPNGGDYDPGRRAAWTVTRAFGAGQLAWDSKGTPTARLKAAVSAPAGVFAPTSIRTVRNSSRPP